MSLLAVNFMPFDFLQRGWGERIFTIHLKLNIKPQFELLSFWRIKNILCPNKPPSTHTSDIRSLFTTCIHCLLILEIKLWYVMYKQLYLIAIRHLPRTRSDVFIFWDSFSRSPTLWVFLALSAPARSQNENLQTIHQIK